MFSLLATPVVVGSVAIVPEHLWQSSFSVSLVSHPSDGPQAPLSAVLITPLPIRTSNDSQTNLYLHCVWRRREAPPAPWPNGRAHPLCARDSVQLMRMRSPYQQSNNSTCMIMSGVISSPDPAPREGAGSGDETMSGAECLTGDRGIILYLCFLVWEK